MKKFVSYWKQMDQTKRIVILFITVSFAFIVGISYYRSMESPSFKPKDMIEDISDNKTTLNKNDKIVNNNQEKTVSKKKDTTKETVSPTQKKKDNEKKDNQNTSKVKTNPKKENKQTTEKKDNDSQTDKKQPQVEVPEKVNTIQIKVKGIDKIIMSGNVEIDERSTALSVLKTIASQNQLRILTSGFGSMTYVRGIGDLVEKEHGSGSGWMYKVNGKSPNVAAGGCYLKDGDSVVWYYVYSD